MQQRPSSFGDTVCSRVHQTAASVGKLGGRRQQLDGLCSRQTIGGSCVPRLRTYVFRQTVGGPVFSPNYWRVLCSASTDIRFPPNSWRPCVLAKLLEGPVFRVYGHTFSAKQLEALCSRQTIGGSCVPRLRTYVFRQTVGGPV